ncbi:MAG: hypothetical protein QOJ15_3305 [Bradyrhizobium sp.]|jgi:predicted thioesterase|nr:hypothetical protein [Bradyrhizobium sp.]
MIADVVNFAIVGIGFCHTAGRSILSKGLAAGMNTVMSQNWVRHRHRYRARIVSGLTKDL